LVNPAHDRSQYQRVRPNSGWVNGRGAMQISYINVFVTDLEKAIGFYRDKLGLPLQFGGGARP